MKKIFTILLAAFVLISCSSDDDDNHTETIRGNEYGLNIISNDQTVDVDYIISEAGGDKTYQEGGFNSSGIKSFPVTENMGEALTIELTNNSQIDKLQFYYYVKNGSRFLNEDQVEKPESFKTNEIKFQNGNNYTDSFPLEMNEIFWE